MPQWCNGRATTLGALVLRQVIPKNLKLVVMDFLSWSSGLWSLSITFSTEFNGVRINKPVILVTYSTNAGIKMKNCWKQRKTPNSLTSSIADDVWHHFGEKEILQFFYSVKNYQIFIFHQVCFHMFSAYPTNSKICSRQLENYLDNKYSMHDIE